MKATYDSKKKILTLEIPIDEEGRASASGKSIVHATTGGALKLPNLIEDGKVLAINLTAYSSAK